MVSLLSNGGCITSQLNHTHESTELYTSIATQLSHEAVDPHYTPHITLGRDINIDATSIVVQRFPIEVNRISLMESRRINGALTYSELAHVDLIKGE
ncbi:MAG: 2'-5' RNA ligase family protein [Sphaerochaetaceae bacterium]